MIGELTQPDLQTNHDAFEWASSRPPLPILLRQLAQPQGYDLRQSTSASTTTITSMTTTTTAEIQ